jgi:predicted MFS family arabinose efflux permease
MSSVAGASGSVGGAIYGGVVTGTVGWRWVFWLTIPLTLALLVLACRLVPPGAPAHRGRPLDLPGAALTTLAVVGLVVSIMGVGERSMPMAVVLGAAVLAVLAVALLVVHERGHPDPLLPARVLRSRRLVAGCCGVAATSALWSVVAFALSQELQASGATPTGAGLAMLPASAGILLAGTLVVPRLRRRLGSVLTASLGLVVATAATAGFVTYGALPFWLGLLPALIAMGAGLSAAHTGLMEHTLRDGPNGAEGVSAAVLESSIHVGGAISVAAYATAIATVGFDGAYVAAAVFGASGLAGLLVILSRRV